MRVLQTALAGDILNNEVSHAYILTGEQRLEQALSFAMSLNCRNRGDDASPCGECIACRKTADNNHPDIFIVEPERGSIRIEQTRSLIAKLALEKFEGEYKIAIIKDCECLPDAAANNLLKTLEEPPEHTVFLLLTATESKLLATIRSRCRIVHLIDSDNAYTDDSEHEEMLIKAQEILKSLPDLPMYKVLGIAAEWEKDREAAVALCCAVAESLVEAMENCFGRNRDFSLSVQPAVLLSAAEQAQTAAEQLTANVNARACLDMLLLRLWTLLKQG